MTFLHFLPIDNSHTSVKVLIRRNRCCLVDSVRPTDGLHNARIVVVAGMQDSSLMAQDIRLGVASYDVQRLGEHSQPSTVPLYEGEAGP